MRDDALEASVDVARRAVDLSRTLRGQAGLKVRQPLARLWLALPGATLAERDALLDLIRVEANVKDVELIGDESQLVDRGVKVLLPKVGKRLGPKIPAVMAAAREGRFEIHPDGSVTIEGETLARRRGRGPGDAAARHRRRPRRRAGRDHRHDAHAGAASPRATPASSSAPSRTCARRPSSSSTTGSSCGSTGSAAEVEPHLAAVAVETLVDDIRRDGAPADAVGGSVRLEAGEVAHRAAAGRWT